MGIVKLSDFPKINKGNKRFEKLLIEAISNYNRNHKSKVKHAISLFVNTIKNNEHNPGSVTDAELTYRDMESPIRFVMKFHPDRAIRIFMSKLWYKLDVSITDVCNYNCPGCYSMSKLEDGKMHNGVPMPVLKELVTNAANIGVRGFKITGGEVFTRPDAMELIRHAVKCNMHVVIATNGYYIDKYIDELKDVFGDGQRLHIHTSIDAVDPDSNEDKFSIKNYEALKHNIGMLKMVMPKTAISLSTLHNSRLDTEQVNTIADMCSETGINDWMVSVPYIVDSLWNGDADELPTYDDMINISKDVLKAREGKDFKVQIVSVHKDAFYDIAYVNGNVDNSAHPCIGCTGATCVIDAEGYLADCLIAGKDKPRANILATRDIGALAEAQVKDNPWFDIRIDDYAKHCEGCRYEAMCKGQCPINRNRNDRGIDQNNCNMLMRAEEQIWGTLPQKAQKVINKMINDKGWKPNHNRLEKTPTKDTTK